MENAIVKHFSFIICNKVKITRVLAEKNICLGELEEKVTPLEWKIEELKVKNQQRQSLIVALKQQIDKRSENSVPAKFPVPSKIDSNDKTTVAAIGLPKSCEDLKNNGHTANGLYLIMGVEKVESVYCDFSIIPSDPRKIDQFFTSLHRGVGNSKDFPGEKGKTVTGWVLGCYAFSYPSFFLVFHKKCRVADPST